MFELERARNYKSLRLESFILFIIFCHENALFEVMTLKGNYTKLSEFFP